MHWNAWIDPAETGPWSPSEGFEIEAASQTTQIGPEGSELLLRRFESVSLRFEAGSWRRIRDHHRRVPKPDSLAPTTMPLSLPIELQAEAWNNFRAEVKTFNRSVFERR